MIELKTDRLVAIGLLAALILVIVTKWEIALAPIAGMLGFMVRGLFKN